MNKKESAAGYSNVVKTYESHNAIRLYEPNESPRKQRLFTYDGVYGPTSTQEEIFIETVEPVVNSVLDGFNGTIFAFGQTGTGKTYTMEGAQNAKERGVMSRSFKHIFDHISFNEQKKYVVECSYVEIYQEELIDLFDTNNKKKVCDIRGNESNVFVTNLVTHIAKSAENMEHLLKVGNNKRKVGATNMNDRSSRSHAIFTIVISSTEKMCGIERNKKGKLHLVDLSGSERQTKSQSAGIRFKEANKINFSLTVLGTVISSLCKSNVGHVPYRNCKLTRLLQDALGGNSKTVMIANIGPASYNHTESLNTLKYANQAKNIKNKPILDNDSNMDEILNQMQQEVERLRARVQKKRAKQIEANAPIQKKIDEEFGRAVKTFEKYQGLLDKKKKIEEKSTDLLTHINDQVYQHYSLYQKVMDVEEINEAIRQNIDVQELTADMFTALSRDVTKHMNGQTGKLNKTINSINGVRKHTLKIKEEYSYKKCELDYRHSKALKQYKLNKAISIEFTQRLIQQGLNYKPKYYQY